MLSGFFPTGFYFFLSRYISNAFCADSDNPLTAEMMSATIDGLKASFVSIRPDQTVMVIEMVPEDGHYKMTIWCDDMELVGDVIQDLCRAIRIETLEALADFPHEMESFLGVLKDVESHNSTRQKMSAEIADSSNLVKTLVIKAEDARICGDIQMMAKLYSQLFDVSSTLSCCIIVCVLLVMIDPFFTAEWRVDWRI